MDWIKKNPAKFALIVVAVCVIASTVFLAMRVSSYDENFEKKRTQPPPVGTVEKPDTGPIEEAQKRLDTPAPWQPAKDEGSLLVSHLYIFDGIKIVRPDLPGSPPLHPPVPNAWLTEHHLDLLSTTVLEDDPDMDGFSTLLEWKGMDGLAHLDENGPVMGLDGKPLPDDSTDPTKKESHPPYHTRLELAKIVYIPFRLKMTSHDYNPKKPKDVVSAQINTIDRGNKTKFVPVGEDIPGTNFKTDSFEFKEVPGPDNTKIDASELTIINKQTGEKVIMPLGKVVDSPDSHAVFRYRWVAPGGKPTDDFPVRKGQVFHLQPEMDKDYKLIELKGGEGVVEIPGGEKRTFKEIK